jgi:hypothetical protein
MRRYLATTAIVVVGLMLVTTSALAAKGGHGGGGGGSGTTAQITATPNPAPANGTFVLVAGCGFSFAPATMVVSHPLGTETYSVAMWSTGCLDRTGFYTAEPGTYTVQIYQQFGKHNKTSVLEASTTVTVQ